MRPPHNAIVIADATGTDRSGRAVAYQVQTNHGGTRYWLISAVLTVKGPTNLRVLRETSDLKKAHRWGVALNRLARLGRRKRTPVTARDVEGIGHHGYGSARPETHAEKLRRLAERRRRYHQQTQYQGEQGPGYDQRRRRRSRRRSRR